MHHQGCHHPTKELDEHELRELMTITRLRLQEVIDLSVHAPKLSEVKALADERKLLRSAHSKLDAQLTALTAHRRV